MNRKATKKQTNMAKNLMENASSLLFPKTKNAFRSLLPPVINTAMRELSIMAVEAKRVDAIMLFRSVCTARTPFFGASCISCMPRSKLVNKDLVFISINQSFMLVLLKFQRLMIGIKEASF